jgi:hypothetical protein
VRVVAKLTAFSMGDKKSIFGVSSIGGRALGVKGNLTAGYCGRNGGFNMAVSIQVEPILIESGFFQPLG